ncbi:MAG: NAD-glutamate dehydrogenase [Acidimicrobiales bacterium]
MAKLDDDRQAIIDKVVDIAQERVAADQAPRVEEFVRQYYRSVAVEDLAAKSPIDLYGGALAHLNQGRDRPPGTPAVHVYTPKFDEHGWQSTHTAVQLVNDDMPFLVDSVRMELARHGLGLHLLIHPVVRVRRDAAGQLAAVVAEGDASPTSPDERAESFIHVEVDRESDPEVLDGIARDLQRVLGDVRAAVEDWRPMLAALDQVRTALDARPPPVADEELAEAKEFLSWLADDHFTLLGCKEYELITEDGEDMLRTVPGTGLGILREKGTEPVSQSFAKMPPDVRRLARDPHVLTLTKANSVATVHRPTYLDYAGVKRFDPASGEPVGEWRFLGLYTSAVYNGSPMAIPVLRRKVATVLERAGFDPSGHSGKDLLAIIETYPRDELFQIAEDELFETAVGIQNIQERQQVRLFVRRDRFGRFYSCLVYVPRDRYNTQSRTAIQRILMDALHGATVEYQARVSESVLARLHFVIHTELGDVPTYHGGDLERAVADAARTWVDDLHDALVEQCGEDRGVVLFHRYQDAFPVGYRSDFLARFGVADIQRTEALDPAGDLSLHLYRPLEAPDDSVRFKVFRSGTPILVSDVLPLLENMGVRVVDERPYEVVPAGGPQVWIYDFGLTCTKLAALDTDRERGLFQEAFAAVWRGEAESDGFNRLVIEAGLQWREVAVLRAYAKYLRQTGTTFSQAYMEESLAANPAIARLLVELFRVRFDPSTGDALAQRTEASDRIVRRIEEALDDVANLDEDRILRALLSLTGATLRTNWFQTGADGTPKRHVSFKLDPALVPDLPLPRPMFEIFVYSPRMEGVHLRGGRVARGGLRWSDRREDFRTEILGLMKAQMVKNAVIVPVGAKGGFVVKQVPVGADRDAVMAEVVACYKTLLRGMLDVTDNLVRGEAVPPADVVRFDADDTYLVVAADKGTATFSDIANGVSADYGFWLGDAFASGGSAGYDHKAMGITARGAWESVKRHFRGLGVDVQSTDFTVVGVGDMSGDVFGNGMLLSRHIGLAAAFDHRHLFLDPDPDAETSFRERERLFNLPRSSWADYDTSLLSAGGGVIPRTAKSVAITPEVRAVLGLTDDVTALTPNEVIKAILRAPVDLLWNGGIGTYVKASTESHADAGDRTSDAVRIDARELRCRVVGEGGNLGLTQRARTEYALAGGLINTDAIDNSAGVDCSDHEVNIKILLGAVVDDGDLTEKQRNTLLAEMTGEVGALVLRDNYDQTAALQLSVAQAASLVDAHARYVRTLVQAGKLDRELEALPTEDDFAERKAAGQGLTAPEFAVLLAYTKNTLSDELIVSDVPEDPYLSHELARYFPEPLRERFAEPMLSHRLRREIIVTRVVSAMVDYQGTTFAYRITEETGATAADIARAYTVAREVFDLRGLYAAIESLDNKVAAATQTVMLLEGRKLVERGTRWLLRHRRSAIEIAAEVAFFSPAPLELTGVFPELLVADERERFEHAATQLVDAGVPLELAERVAGLDAVYSALDIAEVAAAAGEPVASVGAVYYRLGAGVELHWLRDQVNALPRDSRWQTLARAALRDDLYAQHRELTAAVLRAAGPDREPRARIDAWLAVGGPALERVRQVLGDVKASGVFDLATLSVALREVAACSRQSA